MYSNRYSKTSFMAVVYPKKKSYVNDVIDQARQVIPQYHSTFVPNPVSVSVLEW